MSLDPDATSRLLILLAGIDLIVTAVLIWGARRNRNPALSERAIASVILTTIALGAAALGLNRLGILSLPPGAAIVILSVGLLLVSAPQIIWGVLLATGRFR